MPKSEDIYALAMKLAAQNGDADLFSEAMAKHETMIFGPSYEKKPIALEDMIVRYNAE